MSRLRSTSLPWRRPQHELLLLALVAVAALAPVNATSLDDVSRLCLTRSLVHGQLSVDTCAAGTVDRSTRGGHLYPITAPGLSVLEIPAAEAVRLPSPEHWRADGDPRLWIVRVLSIGTGFLVCVFLVGRVSEGIAPGFGGASLVAFGLGTLLAPLAAVNFDQVPAAALGFGAFALSWRGRPLLAGLAAGAALAVEYQAAAILLVVGAYTALEGGRALLRYAAGALPGVVGIGAYDWAAFGAPWRAPLAYADPRFGTERRSAFLGVHLPTAHGAWRVFLGDRGLLVASPILVAAAIGLVLLWRRGYRAEAAVCGVLAALFAAAACGYFEAPGAISPGPRYLAPALPFLALGLAPMLARLRRSMLVLVGLSIIPTIAIVLTWASGLHYRHTIWRQLAPYPARFGSSRLLPYLEPTAFGWAGLSRHAAAILIALAAASALAVAVADSRQR